MMPMMNHNTTTIIDELSFTNLYGVKLMARGDDNKACKIFLQALVMTTKLLDQNTNISASSSMTNITNNTSSSSSSISFASDDNNKFLKKHQRQDQKNRPIVNELDHSCSTSPSSINYHKRSNSIDVMNNSPRRDNKTCDTNNCTSSANNNSDNSSSNDNTNKYLTRSIRSESSSSTNKISNHNHNNRISTPCKCTNINIHLAANQGNFFLYNKAIIFHPQKKAESISVTDYNDNIIYHNNNLDLTFYSAIIIFNLALCYHKIGNTTGKSVLLRKARVLYGKCTELMKSYSHSVGGTHYLFVAAANNQAHICYEHANVKCHYYLSKVRKYLSRYSHLLLESSLGPESSPSAANFGNELILNLMMSPQFLSTAPTA